MKAVILAGGLGTRLSEETDRIPKPMVTVGNKPILWHIMKLYPKYQISDFVVCAGTSRTPSSSFSPTTANITAMSRSTLRRTK